MPERLTESHREKRGGESPSNGVQEADRYKVRELKYDLHGVVYIPSLPARFVGA